MSNIERRYAYLDEGVFPEEGEYGVTYLTLYSSNAGNTYDGWVYDPDNKVRESLTERTYGYRNPDYPQYCWDDEVVVDLSNAQSRQESSEYTQGRITSFNTNVSDRPIVLQDIDITGLTEEERENLATTVLFSAIPLVQDAYIQAQVEVQCKCNLSPDNTSGEMRIEAFYILNDESDRTMRPNPVHTFTVTSANERHTLPWLYWNPALRHDDHNYIGVKLICTGGTAEIGISDNPDYGDAMITLASAGLTGDHIDSGHPVSLEIFGKEEVVGGYELDINDYTVLCTYDTGEIYEVTRMCTFTPEMGTRIEQAFTTLTAHYQGLNASMTIRLGMVESIELTGVDTFHNKLKLKLSDYTVLAYLDTGDVMDVTAECTFSPAMGTTITSNTTLTATYSPYWMHGASFTDSIGIEQLNVVATDYNEQNGLVYTLYEDNNIVITGNATHPYPSYTEAIENEIIQVPSGLKSYVRNDGYTLEWDAEGTVGGFKTIASASGGDTPTTWYYLCKGFIGFDDVQLSACIKNDPTPNGYFWRLGFIWIDFQYERDLTSNMLRWLGNADDSRFVRNATSTSGNNTATVAYAFAWCRALSDVDFMAGWQMANECTSTNYMFRGCVSLKNINGLRDLNMSNIKTAWVMFRSCSQLETVNGAANWDVSNLEEAPGMFADCESLTITDALWFWRPNSLRDLSNMFGRSGITSAGFLKNWNKSSWQNIAGIVSYSNIIDLDGLQGLDFTSFPSDRTNGVSIIGCPELLNLNGSEDWILASNIDLRFSYNPKLCDISALSEWDTSPLTSIASMFEYDDSLADLSPLSGWDVSNVRYYMYAFRECPNLENLQPLSSWRTSSAISFYQMF
jgi:surface protein